MNKEQLNRDRIILRNIQPEDVHELEVLSHTGFPGMDAFKAENFTSHIKIFPEGQFCVEYDGKLIGSASSMILNFDEFSPEDNFDTVTADGMITNHNPDGQDLYGVDVVVHPDYRGFKIGSMLYEARRNLCKSLNLKRIVFGGRIPGYHKVADKLTAKEYVQEVLDGKRTDPTMSFQLGQGFGYKGIIPNYIPDDTESMGYATLMEWINPDYKP